MPGPNAVSGPADLIVSNESDAPTRPPLEKRLRFELAGSIPTDVRRDCIVDGLLGAGEVSCLYGAPKSGKSALATSLSIAVATGEKWFGLETKRSAVLLCAPERVALTRRRLIASRAAQTLSKLPIGLCSPTDFDLRSDTSSVADIVRMSNYIQQEFGLATGLVVIDTLFRSLAGGDENSPKDMGALLQNVLRVQNQVSAHVMLIHHVGNEANRLRGHSSLPAALDTALKTENNSGNFIATVTHTNDGQVGRKFFFAMNSIQYDFDESTGATSEAAIAVERQPTESDSAPRRKAGARLSDRALNCLRLLPDDGSPMSVDKWKSECLQRGAIDPNQKNPRAAFIRVTDQLLRATAITIEAGSARRTGR